MLIRMQARQLMVGDKVMEGDDPFLVTSVTFDDKGVNVVFEGMVEQRFHAEQLMDVERQLVPDNRLPPGTYTAEFAGVDDNGNPVIDYATVRPVGNALLPLAVNRVTRLVKELNDAIAALGEQAFAHITVNERDANGVVYIHPTVSVEIGKVE